MKAKGIWIFAVGAALSLVIALGVFRSREQGRAGSESASPRAAADADQRSDQSLAKDQPEAGVDTSSSREQDADAHAPGEVDIRETPPTEPVLLPNQVPATPISQALEELQLPPVPELLETERAFAAESVDPVWSTPTEARILGKIAEITGLELVSLNVECRTTLCRLQLAEPDAATGKPGTADTMSLVQSLGLKPRWVISVRDRNGTPVSLAYLERGETAGSSADVPEPPVQ